MARSGYGREDSGTSYDNNRLNRKKWLTKEIYSLIKERKLLVKRLLREKNACLLKDVRKLRNLINVKVEKAKADYIRNLLVATKTDPKKFWRNIKYIIDGEEVSSENVCFKDLNTGLSIDDSLVPNFLNDFFANIAERVCDPLSSKVFVPDDVPLSRMFFIPPEQFEIIYVQKKSM